MVVEAGLPIDHDASEGNVCGNVFFGDWVTAKTVLMGPPTISGNVESAGYVRAWDSC